VPAARPRALSSKSELMESRVQDELKLHLTDNASTASRYVVGVFLSLLSALGTVGNATVLWVFWAPWSLQVYRVYLRVFGGTSGSLRVYRMYLQVFCAPARHLDHSNVCRVYLQVFWAPVGHLDHSRCTECTLSVPLICRSRPFECHQRICSGLISF